jgi:hypothetical protein
MLEFYTDNVHKARKVHKCDLCYQEISVGEQYHRQSGKYEGEFFDRCIHNHCEKIIATFCKEHNENEYSPDWIEDWLSDNHCYSCEKKEECEVNILQCGLILEHFKGV